MWPITMPNGDATSASMIGNNGTFI
jgi:hypothetical protein